MHQWTEGTPGQEWDDALFKAGGHFLQSSHWAAFNVKLGRRVFYAYGPSWQCLAILEPARTGTRLYCPYGPLAKNMKGLASALEALRQLAKMHKAVFARVEPTVKASTAQLRELELKPALKDIQPRLTWVLDLKPTEEELLKNMTATNRNLYNNYKTKGLHLRASDNPADMHIFIKMMAEVALRNGIRQHSDHYYKTMAGVLLPRGAAKLYIAEHNGQPVASAFCFDSPTTRYYAHAAALFAARKLHPGTPLLAAAILAAKAQGQTQFDFVGVAPADAPPTHRWAGLTKFKQSFGGDYKAYCGTWELPVSWLRYGVYRGAYLVKRRLQ
ncbi:MAG TPA: peptidoglycan bridge formation glycyltransferase FemA/FemB family protein [Candidatus Saccharimonadales bacterium]|nr:peptidoglycan bridge formation glycyltransferase FemA/FemB family protein [Candidatus Saccharimonadales bacterium]